jgi:hypothetical protein
MAIKKIVNNTWGTIVRYKAQNLIIAISIFLSACAAGPVYETSTDVSKSGFINRTKEKHSLLSIQSIDGKNLDFGTKMSGEPLPVLQGKHYIGLRAWFNHHWLVGRSCSVPATRQLNEDKRLPCGIYSLVFAIPTNIEAGKTYQLFLSELNNEAKFNVALKDTTGRVIWEKNGLTALRQDNDDIVVPYIPLRVK